MPKHRCQHCGTAEARYKFRLCGRCNRFPDIVAMYSEWSYELTGHGRGKCDRPAPKTPTDAEPGSEAKVRVLEQRAAADVGLWHPDDAPLNTAGGDDDEG